MSFDLTAEAINKIGDLAVLASGANSVSVTIQSGRAQILDTKTGKLTFQDVPELPPKIIARGIDDLEKACEKYGHIECSSAVFVSESNVVLLFDETRIGSATMRLAMNPAIKVMQTMRDKTLAQLWRLLRVDLYGIETAPHDFCEVISNLKFEATQTNEVKLAKGDESIGKSIRSKVTAESEIPDTVKFTLSVYPDLVEVSTDVTIDCAVVTEATNGTVNVIPYPGQIERAINFSVSQIANHLRQSDSGWSVFCGVCE